MSGAGFGHGGAVGEILDALPLDATFHVTDCGFDDDGRCGCYDLPSALRRIVAAHIAAAEQRGREDNEDHGLCYVHGSKALDAYVAEHVARFKAEAVAAIEAQARRDATTVNQRAAYRISAATVANLTPSDP